VRALWVDSFNPGLRSPAEIDALVARAKSGNLNAIIAQVRRNAQSLYAISFEGWVENYAPPAGFDPLQYLIEKAHAEGIEVHAWANIGAVFTGNPNVPTASFPCKRPCDPSHLFNVHGYGVPDEENWLTRAHPSFLAGTTFSGWRQSNGTWFIDLGHPGAAEHTIDVLTHLLRNYDVDGIHLDYIRFPEMPIASPRPPGVGLPFAIGYNPTSVKRFNTVYGRAEGSLPNPWDASFSQWRRDQVTAFVRRLYLEMNYIRPEAKLSAALITFYLGPNATEPRTFQQTEAYYRVFQDWGGWMKEGILDMSIPMIYKSHHISSHVTQFRQWIEFTKEAQHDRHGVIGLGAYMNNLENTLVQIDEGRAPSLSGALSRGFNFFSYNATNQAAAGKPLRPRDELFRALTEDGAYAVDAPFSMPVSVPEMVWKSDPRVGHLRARSVTADGTPADGALVTIAKVGAGPKDEEIVQYADGNGYVGGVDLNPGAYQLVIAMPGSEDRVTVPEPVVPGRVTRLTVDLGRPNRGPMARAERTFGANERTDHLEGASELEEWQGREPIPEDLVLPPPVEP
ncbi:MAG TPA: family 10 glycosylhydrolase, partial [Thermoanaerobaculia bacterium]